MAAAERTTAIRQLWPLLLVRDIERSISFYRDQLGFTLVNQAEAHGRMFWYRPDRGGAAIMLQQADEEDGPAEGRGRGVAFYFICDDPDAMHTELTSRGLRLNPPKIAYYGMKQLPMPEPDGYSICFESEIEHQLKP